MIKYNFYQIFWQNVKINKYYVKCFQVTETLNPVRGFRRRLVTVGPILFMRSNQKIHKNSSQDVPVISVNFLI